MQHYFSIIHSYFFVIIFTMVITLLLQRLYFFFLTAKDRSFKKKLMDKLFQFFLRLPYLGKKLQAKIKTETENLVTEIKTELLATRTLWKSLDHLPYLGLSEDEIRERFKYLNVQYRQGRCSSTKYTEFDGKLSRLLQDVWRQTALTNPLYPQWPLINLMEAEIIAMCQTLLHGDKQAPGLITHGGSMTILEACKAYICHSRKKGLKHPEILAPESVHISFDKAAEILNAKLVKVPINFQTGTIDLKRFEKAINKNTCLIVGSAPSFPFGVIDPIADMAKIAKEHDIFFHVDSALGGFLTMFAQKAGFNIPTCDFSLSGVTSISIGTHKYAQSPNGTSILLFSTTCPASPIHVYLDWMAGLYASPSIDGTRSGADIALLWSVLCYRGEKNYIEETKKLLELKDNLVKKLKTIQEIVIPYDPKLSIIPLIFKNNTNPLLVAQRLKEIGSWSVNILQSQTHTPLGFHFCLTPLHVAQKDFAEIFVRDLCQAIEYAKIHARETPKGLASAYVKLQEGVPLFVQEKLGRAYIKMLSSI